MSSLASRNNPNSYLSGISLFMGLIFLVLFSSCETEETLPTLPCSAPTKNILLVQRHIIGKWVWTYEKFQGRGMIYPEYRTPQSEGYKKQFEFRSDKSILIHDSRKPLVIAKFEIETFASITGFPDDSIHTTLVIRDALSNSLLDFAPIHICSDSLTLNYGFYSDAKGIQKWRRN